MPQTMTMRVYFPFNSLRSNNRKNTFLQGTVDSAYCRFRLLALDTSWNWTHIYRQCRTHHDFLAGKRGSLYSRRGPRDAHFFGVCKFLPPSMYVMPGVIKICTRKRVQGKRVWLTRLKLWPDPLSVLQLCISVDFVSYTVAWGFMLGYILITHATAPCSDMHSLRLAPQCPSLVHRPSHPSVCRFL